MATRMKRRLRGAADQAARLSGLLARRERARAAGLTVLTYHRVLPAERCVESPFPSLAMPLDDFRQQVAWVASHGEVLPLAQALERARRRGWSAVPGQRPLYALTFDDGYRDAAEHAAPVLEQAGVRGTFFVTTGFVGSGAPLWFDAAAQLFALLSDAARRALVERACGGRAPALPPAGAGPGTWAAALKYCPPAQRHAALEALESAAGGPAADEGCEALSVGQLVALHRAGHEIGSHSVSHPVLTTLDDAELEAELSGAQRALTAWLGAPAQGFCYPNGDHDARVAAAVARAGHSYACTTQDGLADGSSDPFELPRVDVVHERVSSGGRRFDATAFRRELCGLYRRRERAPAAGRGRS
jgi:peptidoglycan/xylan/chitin deacetylase (PgdA/CDA1 family)